MAVIRKVLTPLEIMPKNVRYNDGTNQFETSPDNGATWNPDESVDPRHNNAYRKPPLTGGDKECDGAARIVHALQDSLIIFNNSVDAAQYASFILTAFIILSPAIGILANIALLAFDTLVEIGQANINAAFTEEVWDDLKCIIACHLGDDAQMSVDQRDAIMADVLALHPGTVYNTIVNMVNLFGEVLMSNATVEYTDEGDCSECSCYSWQQCFNFRDGDIFAFEPILLSGRPAAQWIGNGWLSQYVNYCGIIGDHFQFLYFGRLMPAMAISKIVVRFESVSYGSGSLTPTSCAVRYADTDFQATTASGTFDLVWEGNLYFAGPYNFNIFCNLDYKHCADGAVSGLARVTDIYMSGVRVGGVHPFGEDNCE